MVVRVFVRVLRDTRLVHEHLRVLVLRRLLDLDGARLLLMEIIEWERESGGGGRQGKENTSRFSFFFLSSSL